MQESGWEGKLTRSRRRIRSWLFTLLAVQERTEILLSPSHREHPRAIREWRLMSHMLSMTTDEIGYPITLVILMISDDGLLHILTTDALWPTR